MAKDKAAEVNFYLVAPTWVIDTNRDFTEF